jgi:hypothetical protein
MLVWKGACRNIKCSKRTMNYKKRTTRNSWCNLASIVEPCSSKYGCEFDWGNICLLPSTAGSSKWIWSAFNLPPPPQPVWVAARRDSWPRRAASTHRSGTWLGFSITFQPASDWARQATGNVGFCFSSLGTWRCFEMQLRWTNVFNPGQDYRLVVCSPPLDLIFFFWRTLCKHGYTIFRLLCMLTFWVRFDLSSYSFLRKKYHTFLWFVLSLKKIKSQLVILHI